jgi:high-affinity K+ transport system ATPase subunit B
MNDDPTEKVPDGVIKLDVGCFRQKTPREMSLEYLEAALKRIFEQGPPQPPAERGKQRL